MPRENRKRGKRTKKNVAEEPAQVEKQFEEAYEEPQAGPSWILPTLSQDSDLDAPFGLVDADVKVYFKTVDAQNRQWQDSQGQTQEGEEDSDPSAEKQMFFLAALSEMKGKEKSLATDADCSIVLERMAYSMDDFVKRVFIDSLSGSYEILFKHRFASHVCQTLLNLAPNTLVRESSGVLPSVPTDENAGELRTLTALILDMSEELLPSIPSLMMDSFASHVVRALLLVLMPSLATSNENNIRSKRSSSWKSRQGEMKSIFSEEKGKSKEYRVSPQLREMAKKIVRSVLDTLNDNEIRAMAANKVASPALHVLLEVEAELDMSNEVGSLLDRLLDGIVAASLTPDAPKIEESDYLSALLRDSTSSHLTETLFLRSSDAAFSILWDTYCSGKLIKLASHPIANFVLAKSILRISSDQLGDALSELSDAFVRFMDPAKVSSRIGVLKSLTERALALSEHLDQINEAVYTTFHMKTAEERLNLIQCVLHLQCLEDLKLDSNNDKEKGPIKVPGALLLQTLLQFPPPFNQPVIDSLLVLSVEQRIALAYNPTASRVLDVYLESPTVPFKFKRQYVLAFIGHYDILVDDRIGSRVCDRLWAFADTYTKEKIARSLIPKEHNLVASFYGKFFARNLNLYLLQKRPEEWKDMQSRKKDVQVQSHRQQPESKVHVKVQKRKRENEIDDLFDEMLGNRIKKGVLNPGKAVLIKPVSPETGDLKDVLGAIREAPGNTKSFKKAKKHR